MSLTAWRIVAAIAGAFVYWGKNWSLPNPDHVAFNIMAGSLLLAAVAPQAWRSKLLTKIAFALVGVLLVVATAFLVYRDLTGPYITDYLAAILQCAISSIFFLTVARKPEPKR